MGSIVAEELHFGALLCSVVIVLVARRCFLGGKERLRVRREV